MSRKLGESRVNSRHAGTTWSSPPFWSKSRDAFVTQVFTVLPFRRERWGSFFRFCKLCVLCEHTRCNSLLVRNISKNIHRSDQSIASGQVFHLTAACCSSRQLPGWIGYCCLCVITLPNWFFYQIGYCFLGILWLIGSFTRFSIVSFANLDLLLDSLVSLVFKLWHIGSFTRFSIVSSLFYTLANLALLPDWLLFPQYTLANWLFYQSGYCLLGVLNFESLALLPDWLLFPQCTLANWVFYQMLHCFFGVFNFV